MISNKVRRDGHMHSPYCPHGTKDTMESYVEQAIAAKLEEITFTEHMPLPDGVLDPELQRECGLEVQEVKPYFREIDLLKQKYQGKLKINKGLEVDYVEGYEEETKQLLENYGKELEDGLLSVHILKIKGKYYCIDLSPEEFGKLINLAGGLKELYDQYFMTLLKAIKADLGPYKPRRIGHPTLPRIYNLKYPIIYENKVLLEEVIEEIKTRDYQVDFNTAGLRKPFCGESYPSGLFLELVKKYDIKMVYGSDAHTAGDVGRDFN